MVILAVAVAMGAVVGVGIKTDTKPRGQQLRDNLPRIKNMPQVLSPRAVIRNEAGYRITTGSDSIITSPERSNACMLDSIGLRMMSLGIFLVFAWTSTYAASLVITPSLDAPQLVSIQMEQCVISPRRFVLVPVGSVLVAYGDHREPCIVPGANDSVTLDTQLDCLEGENCSGTFSGFELRISTVRGCRIEQEDAVASIPDCVFQGARISYQRFAVRSVERPLVHGVYHGRMNDSRGSFQFSETLTAAVTKTGSALRVELKAVGPLLPAGGYASYRQRDWSATAKAVLTVLESDTDRRVFFEQFVSGIRITESNGASVILRQQDSEGRELVSILSDSEREVDPRRIPGSFRMYGPDPFGIGQFELKQCVEQRDRTGSFVLSINCPIHRHGRVAGQLSCWAPATEGGAVMGGNLCEFVVNGSSGVLTKRMREGLFGLDAWYNEEALDPQHEYVLISTPFALRTE